MVTDAMVEVAADVFCSHGIEIHCPWNGGLDDLEQERFDALRAALEAAETAAKPDDYIDNWHGKPIGSLSRGELIDALDWCVRRIRKTWSHV